MNEISMKKIRKEELKISGRKDWVIFWIFAVMIAYVAGGWFDRPINEWLRGMTGPWLTDLNMPSNYGRTIGAVILLAVLAEGLLFLRKKPVKAKIGAAAAGAALVIAIVGIHQVHCGLIVSVLHSQEPNRVTLFLGEGPGRAVSEEECRELLELCRSLEVVTDTAEQADCLAWYEAEGNRTAADSVWLKFPRKYGHHYSLNLDVQDGHIYLWRGYQGQEKMITFFQDNGLVAWLEGKKEAVE